MFLRLRLYLRHLDLDLDLGRSIVLDESRDRKLPLGHRRVRLEGILGILKRTHIGKQVRGERGVV
jgi:hypothetical protein